MASLKDSFTKGLTTLNVKTNNFMEESKCKTYITTLEGDIKNLKTEIGNSVYTKWATSADMTEGVEELCNQIKAKYDEISAQQVKIQQLQTEAEQILGSATAPQAAPAPEGPVKFCAQCGTQNAANYKFCAKCGNPLQ